MKKIAIVAALPGEVKPLVCGWRAEKRNGTNLWFETRQNQQRVAAFAGIGVAAAARALAEIERDGPAQVIVSIGWVGALRADLPTGTAFRVTHVLDETTGERFPCALVSPAAERSTEVSPFPGPSAAASSAAESATATPHDFSAVQLTPSVGALRQKSSLTCVTLARFANSEDKQRLSDQVGADLVDMEAAALARIAAQRGIPFYCIKAISDGLTDDLPDFTQFIDAAGQLQLARFAGFAVTHPKYLPALIRLGRETKKAAENLRVSLLAILENVATATP